MNWEHLTYNKQTGTHVDVVSDVLSLALVVGVKVKVALMEGVGAAASAPDNLLVAVIRVGVVMRAVMNE